MTQFTPGLIIEILLVLLLAVTVGYCMILNRRLGTLRSSQSELRQIVFELGSATQTAETAIRGLKATTDDAETRLSESLHRAQLMARELTVLIDGDAKPAAPEPAPQPLLPSQVVAPPVVAPPAPPRAAAPQVVAPPAAVAEIAPRPVAKKSVVAKRAAAKPVASKAAAPKPVAPKVSAAQSTAESDAAAKERALWRQRTLSKLKNAG